MSSNEIEKRSRNFSGQVGTIIPPRQFPVENYSIDESRYNSEGNWAFCRFFNEQVYAARLGFQRGAFDLRDYGVAPVDSYLQLHLELMMDEGAVSWIATGQYRPEQVALKKGSLDLRLTDGGKQIFHVQGWPDMRWHFQSDDGILEADLGFDLLDVIILPDCLLQHNLFAMWLATGRVKGNVRFHDRNIPVEGVVFYDHPRITVTPNDVSPRQWYLYTPLFFQDGSILFSYYTVDDQERRVLGYSFGMYITADGDGLWLPSTRLSNLKFDQDGLPEIWQLAWQVGEFRLAVEVSVKPTSIQRIWGSPELPKTRSDFVYIPLVLDAVARVFRDGEQQTLSGVGLSEYWHMPGVDRIEPAGPKP
ncbi:MAG: hypothetical protein P8074_06435 [Anaerolineales bacterium]|jgi:hypothetical protein